jgi:hypothetical protein
MKTTFYLGFSIGLYAKVGDQWYYWPYNGKDWYKVWKGGAGDRISRAEVEKRFPKAIAKWDEKKIK